MAVLSVLEGDPHIGMANPSQKTVAARRIPSSSCQSTLDPWGSSFNRPKAHGAGCCGPPVGFTIGFIANRSWSIGWTWLIPDTSSSETFLVHHLGRGQYPCSRLSRGSTFTSTTDLGVHGDTSILTYFDHFWPIPNLWASKPPWPFSHPKNSKCLRQIWGMGF